MEVMTGLARSLRGVATLADRELQAARHKAEKLPECLDLLRQLFRAASLSKGTHSGHTIQGLIVAVLRVYCCVGGCIIWMSRILLNVQEIGRVILSETPLYRGVSRGGQAPPANSAANSAADSTADAATTDTDVKRLASLDLVNQQIKIHFQLNTIRMCIALMRAVEGPGFLPFESFPAAARATYKYYTGRLAIFDEDHVRSLPR